MSLKIIAGCCLMWRAFERQEMRFVETTSLESEKGLSTKARGERSLPSGITYLRGFAEIHTISSWAPPQIDIDTVITTLLRDNGAHRGYITCVRLPTPD
jgi:hypothetical protein